MDAPPILAKPRNSHFRRWGIVLALIVVVALASAQSLRWVFLVPIYQSPDEPAHLDYALAIWAHGGPFLVQETTAGALPPTVHPYTSYLHRQATTQEVAFSPTTRMQPDYGTSRYFDELDANAPALDGLRIEHPPQLAATYPCGYYALLALWIQLLSCIQKGVLAIFFGARIFSVVLLALSLFLNYGVIRLLGFTSRFALLLVACIGFFPLTSFVSSYVQPDNLAFALVSLSFYLGLRARRADYSITWLSPLGLSLGLLLLTKLHFWFCVASAILLMLVADRGVKRSRTAWRREIPLLCLPSAMALAYYCWSLWGTPNAYGSAVPQAFAPGHLIRFLSRAFNDYRRGTTNATFWSVFGWVDTQLIIGSPRIQYNIERLIQLLSWTVLGLTLLRIKQIFARLVSVGRSGRFAFAVRAVFSNPVINAYFLFMALMFFLYVRTENQFGAQGRNWYPFLLPIFLVTVSYAPKAITIRRPRAIVAGLLSCGLLAYCLVGNSCAISTLKARYYFPASVENIQTTGVSIEPSGPCEAARGSDSETDPPLIINLPRPMYVYGVRLQCSTTASQPVLNMLQLFWRDEHEAFKKEERNGVFRSDSTGRRRTFHIAVNRTISQLRIGPDVSPCHFKIFELTLLHP